MAIQDAFPKREDLVIGNNDPFFDNTWDRGQLAIQAALQVAHDSDGKHPSNVMGLLQRYGVLTGAYAGDGAASRSIALSDATFQVSHIILVSAASANWHFTTTTGTGQFSVTSAEANSAGVAYYYVVFGLTARLGDGNGATYAPAWIQHGERIEVGGAARAVPNALCQELLDKFLVEHAENGTHRASAYVENGVVAVGAFTLAAHAAQTVTLPASRPIRALWIYGYGSDFTLKPRYYIAQNMPAVCLLERQMLGSPGVTLATGQFVIDGAYYVDSAMTTTINIPSNHAHGSTAFSDVSGYAHAFSQIANVSHVTGYYYTAPSSVKFIGSGSRLHVTPQKYVDDWCSDFSISCYVEKSAQGVIFSRNSVGGVLLKIENDKLYGYVGGGTNGAPQTAFGNTAFRRVELKRVNGVCSVLIGSTVQGSTFTNTMMFDSFEYRNWEFGWGDNCSGQYPEAASMTGWIDDMVVQAVIRRYTFDLGSYTYLALLA